MKKNVMMRVASALLVAVLLSTCAISGTFAKYVTEASGADSARVAKWGVEITANGETFQENYDNTAISATTDVNIVAPGTAGSLVAMTLSGAPEVKVEVSYAASLDLAGWTVEGAYYCPIVITVGTTPYDGNSYSSAAAFEAAVEGAINDYTAEYDANVDLATSAETPVVTWAWAFAGDDVKDTALGNAAADGNAATILLSITTTVTQID